MRAGKLHKNFDTLHWFRTDKQGWMHLRWPPLLSEQHWGILNFSLNIQTLRTTTMWGLNRFQRRNAILHWRSATACSRGPIEMTPPRVGASRTWRCRDVPQTLTISRNHTKNTHFLQRRWLRIVKEFFVCHNAFDNVFASSHFCHLICGSGNGERCRESTVKQQSAAPQLIWSSIY